VELAGLSGMAQITIKLYKLFKQFKD